MNVEKVKYLDWPNCHRLSNDKIDLVVTTDVGPRIIRCGLVGQVNEMAESLDITVPLDDGSEWKIYGGHRLWHSPEINPRTYFPDQQPVKFEQHGGFVRLIQQVETTTGIEKQIDIAISNTGPSATITHRMINRNMWAVQLAPWALSVMAPGGRGIVPLPPRRSHEEVLLPANTMTLWAYTDMSDPRWTWGRKYVMLQQDPKLGPQKLGMSVPDGWAAYANHGHLFVKTFNFDADATYPDAGSCVEIFTCEVMLELETVAPLVTLEPSGQVEHVENWHLFDGVPLPQNDDDIDRDARPKIESVL